jgi:hypothetical protein
MAVSSFFDGLYNASPVLAVALKFLLLVCVVLLLWIVVSIPVTIAYVALRKGLYRGAKYLATCAKALLEHARAQWRNVSEVRADAIEQLTIRYVYDGSESRYLRVLNHIGKLADAAGVQVQAAIISLEDKLSPLARSLRAVVELRDSTTEIIQIPEIKELQQSGQMRRTAMIALLVCIPIMIALIGINTGLLTKFFESFIEDYISYNLGVKWSTIFGLFFSVIELALGILLYYVGKPETRDALIGPLKKLVIVLLILGLACIEAYLYLLLSADIGRQIKESNIILPSGLEGMHSWWLAPLGFVVVITLAFIGHSFIDAVNKFADAGHLKELRAALADVKRSWASVDSIWAGVQSKSQGAKTALLEFERELLAEQRVEASALSAVQGAIEKLSETAKSLIALRREPVSKSTTAESAGIFDAQTLFAVTFLVTLLAFCWLQIHFLGKLPDFKDVNWVVYLLIALVEATAILVSSYKAYPVVTTLVEGHGSEAIRSARERATSAICLAIIAASVLFNLLLTRQESEIRWAIMFFAALVAIGGLALLGRTLPLLTFVLGVMTRQALAITAAGCALLLSGLTWITYVVISVVIYLLYFLAFPFLFFFVKSALGDPITVIDAE